MLKHKIIISIVILLAFLILSSPTSVKLQAEETNITNVSDRSDIHKILSDDLIISTANFSQYLPSYKNIENMLLDIKNPKNNSNIFKKDQITPGQFDEKMEMALKNFQNEYLLLNEEKYLNGKIDSSTLKKIISLAVLSKNKYALETFGNDMELKNIEDGLIILLPQNKSYPKKLIVDLQNKLKLVFSKNGKPLIGKDNLSTGKYCENTSKAVANFQNEFLDIDKNNWRSGLMDNVTYKKLTQVLSEQKSKSVTKIEIQPKAQKEASNPTSFKFSPLETLAEKNPHTDDVFSGETYKKQIIVSPDKIYKPYGLTISQGQSKALSYPSAITNVAVGSPDIADVVIISNREILINGIKPGATTLGVWYKGGKKSYVINVTKAQIGKIVHVFKLKHIKLQKTKTDKCLSTITIEDDKSVIDPLEKMLKTVIDCDSFSLFTSLGIISVLGTSDEIARVDQLLKKIDIPIDQIILETRIIESSKEISRKLGADWAAQGGQYAGSFTGTDTGGGILTFTQDANLSRAFAAQLTTLENAGKIKTLASPKILAESGKASDIYVGTTIPIISVSQDGTQTYETLETGVKLAITPRTNFDGSISIWLATFVSDITSTLYQGYPAISTKYAQTTTSVQDGETLVIGGLKFNYTKTTDIKLPFIGDIPILGYLFKRETKQKNEKEIIITITPHILSKIPFK